MGIVVDRGRAEESPCTCFPIEPEGPETPENLLCFSKGVVGALSDRQDRELCTERQIGESKGLQRRLRTFRKIGAINDVCLESEVEDTVGCFKRGAELMERGIRGKEFERRLAR
ncbi:MAG: hypothetical protein GWN12_09840, partial [Thermoplasmata archaeon]|nr:hypothetical protein [Thermoplasmata archaeon]NIT78421.1 hypothetical protein [Thermoplasmata archaeon]NIW89061.1 hypothetical protein [Thermoplasmata archaeon]NIY04790.1 hypothetical protein [Thermoplasmata archaeon]